MSVAVDVRAEQIGRLVVALRAAPKELRRELYRGANAATKPVRQDMQASILPSLPSRGGLASEIHSATRLTTSLRPGSTPGASIKVSSPGHDVRRLNQGRLRHPVYGNRRRWVNQTAGVIPRFLDTPFDNSVDDVRRELLKAIDRVAAALYRKV